MANRVQRQRYCILVFAGWLSLSCSGCFEQAKPLKPIDQKEIGGIGVYLKGSVEPREIQILTAPAKGVIGSSLKLGQYIDKGGVILEMVSAEDRWLYTELNQKIKGKKLERDHLKSKWLREERLLQSKSTSREEYEVRENAYRLSENELTLLEGERSFVKSRLDRSKKVAETPVIIVEIFRNKGEKAEQGERIAAFYDPSDLHVLFKAPKGLFGKLQIGRKVLIRNLMANEMIPGVVTWVTPFIDAGTFEAAVIPEPAGRLIFGKGQELEIHIQENTLAH